MVAVGDVVAATVADGAKQNLTNQHKHIAPVGTGAQTLSALPQASESGGPHPVLFIPVDNAHPAAPEEFYGSQIKT